MNIIKQAFEKLKYSPKQMKIISFLRHKTSGNILKIINNKKAISHGELANQLSITSQGLTWQIHRLEKEGFIQETSNGLKQTYFINHNDAQLVNQLINTIE